MCGGTRNKKVRPLIRQKKSFKALTLKSLLESKFCPSL